MYASQVDPHHRLPIRWSNSDDFDSSMYYIYYNQEGIRDKAETLYVWNIYTGKILGTWKKPNQLGFLTFLYFL